MSGRNFFNSTKVYNGHKDIRIGQNSFKFNNLVIIVGLCVLAWLTINMRAQPKEKCVRILTTINTVKIEKTSRREAPRISKSESDHALFV